MKKLMICFLFTSGLTFAQEPVELELSEAVSYALEHKADAEKARLDIDNADAQIAEVRANALPNISASAATTYNPLLQQNILPGEFFGAPGEDIAVAFGRKWNSNANVQLSQVLFNQAVFTGLKAAKSTKEFYQLNAQLTNEEIIETVATAYYQVYQSQQMLENINSNLELTEQTLKIVEGLYVNGLAKKIDYDRTKVALNNLISNKQQAINAVELSENALKFMIGMSIAQEITLPEQNFQPAFLPGTDLKMSERTELALLDKQMELLKWQKKATLAEYYPSASLVGNYGWLGQGNEIPLWNGKDQGVFWSDLGSIGVNISIPIFNGGATKARVKQNQIEIEKAQEDFQETELALQLAYKNAIAQLENSFLTIETQEENVTLAQEVLEDTQNNYELGLASLNDMLDVERELAEAKNNLTNAQLDYKLAEVSLLKSQGKLETLKENNL
ncbi:TolC family protein [Salegentibacter sp. F188]|uniref:TolC family protein n=1 Tax=Autumnicola patrickiae TaxID=3075591 RepID=A0ABU3E595_9FLAO|nr:TolC family protein [Salegentibacter sp. F188]MDT0690809.1 TolC family protein [Salegentibacter sp. F188]